jgi:hypothetical protein
MISRRERKGRGRGGHVEVDMLMTKIAVGCVAASTVIFITPCASFRNIQVCDGKEEQHELTSISMC